MSALFDNAVRSIRMGVEDFGNESDDGRWLSAVRNFYAGVLLLAKETLVRSAPNADAAEIIGAKYKPVPDGEGGVEHVADGFQTIDFTTIAKRFRDFEIPIDHEALRELNAIRNEIEHRYTEKPVDAVREAIAKGFPVTASLFRLIEENPVDHLGPAWQVMIDNRAVFDQEVAACRASLENVEWLSGTIAAHHFSCSFCRSDLVEQADPANDSQSDLELRCRSCGEQLDADDVLVELLKRKLEGDAYIRAKEGDFEGPLYDCPECGNNAYVDFEAACAVCGHVVDEVDCARCGSDIPLGERLESWGPGTLCSYCAHMADKVMRE